MTAPFRIARMAVLPLVPDEAGGVPEWIHILPAGDGAIRTFDGRGPYTLEDAAEVIAASLEDPRGILVDENHATDLAAPEGREAPARGWVRELEVRPDGIWGRVDWTSAGRVLLADRAYRGISPVFQHDPAGRIVRILRASLTNTPNLRGLTALHSEETPMFQREVAEALGLDPAAAEEAILTRARDLSAGTALQSSLAEIGSALGVDGADPAAILAAARSARAAPPAVLATLQSEVLALTTQLNAVTAERKRTAAEAYLDAEHARGNPVARVLRDHYIARHMADPAAVETELSAMPAISAGAILPATPPGATAGAAALNAQQLAVARLLNIDPAKFAETLAAEKETR